ncbi:hypothetical protein [Methyloferula stellata]|uniref:hypothetical protein n=1 Tax=Methyloferula stellata TaxID=876270 RepID=UPI0012690408|nr:hypothetical protein [Methyloferula stellata]
MITSNREHVRRLRKGSAKLINRARALWRVRNPMLLGFTWHLMRAVGRQSWLIDLGRAIFRKRRVKAIFGTDLVKLRPAAFSFHQTCHASGCDPTVELVASYARICLRAEQAARWSGLLYPTPLVLDLGRFATFDIYRKAVSKVTGGRYHRSANKAARLGYTARPIDVGAFAAGAARIRTSKVWRSHGPVREAIFSNSPDYADLEIEPSEPACHEHWTQAWGVFGPLKGSHGLVAHAVLRRAGNVVSFDFFMGHADVLKDGVTKLLMFEIMKWMLDRKDPSVRGLEFAFQGVVEVGRRGIIDWKRYVQFEPRCLILADDRPFEYPAGFDPDVYLQLNPDVRAAGVDPKHHFICHGLEEGRPYRHPAKERTSEVRDS